MPSIHELDAGRTLLGSANDSDSESLLEESVSFIRPVDRPKKKSLVSRRAVLITTLIVVTVLLLAILPSHRQSESPDSEITKLEPQYFREYNSKRVKIRYGPYEVPPSHVENGMKNYVEQQATLPCQGCLITWMQADLVYPDGTTANADTGMWLHHTVLTDTSSEDAKGCKYHGERFFASGNERTVVDISMNGTSKTAYRLRSPAHIIMATELMNARSTARSAYVTITYEYIPTTPIPSSNPAVNSPSSDFSPVKSIWLDIGGCRNSEVPVPKGETQFHYLSKVWKSSVSGRILFVLGHLHDGGMTLDVRNGEETVCRSEAGYGIGEMTHGIRGRHVGVGRRHGDGGGHDGIGMNHIESMSMCYDVGRIETGEEWSVRADYDVEAHAPMLDANGKPEGVMGIAVMYMVED